MKPQGPISDEKIKPFVHVPHMKCVSCGQILYECEVHSATHGYCGAPREHYIETE